MRLGKQSNVPQLYTRFLRLFVACSLFTPFIAVNGQQSDADPAEDFFELPPFEVSTHYDRGYLSTNTTSGTSLNMMVRDLPMSLEVINQEFIQDLQATDMDETLAYSAGVFTQSFQSNSSAVSSFNETSPSSVGDVNNPFQNAISIRGYKVPNQQRMGFRVGGIVPAYGVVLGGSTDTVTTARTEVVRGPQALLYGINVLSGIVNIMPKRPLPKQMTSVGLTVGSHDLYRATLDATGPVIADRLNYRIMAAYHKQDDPYGVMFRNDERYTTALQFDYQITKGISLFVEYVRAEQRSEGIGTQFFQDDGSGGKSGFNWENEWGENIRYGYDDHNKPVMDEFGQIWENPIVQKPGADYSFPDLGHRYNISGPDTYLEREENNLLALLTITPTTNLSVELGAYFTELEDEEFNVNLVTFTNSRGPILPSDSASNVFFPNRWIMNPEAAGAQDDPIGYGIGEGMAFPRVTIVPVSYWSSYSIEPPARDNPSRYDRKFARYIWYKRPTSADTMQLRGRVAYKLEQEIFGTVIQHNLVAGYHYIEDDVNFVNAGVGNSADNHYYSRHSNSRLEGREAEDPVYFRDSVFDYSPIRYNGEIVAIPGNRSHTKLGGLLREELAVTRSGWKEANLWYRGIYGIYQGQMWNDRLTLIGGIRRDSYQVKEKEQLLVMDHDRLSDQWVGFSHPIVPGFIGYGDRPYTYRDDLPDALNQQVEESIARIRATQPNGTIEYDFPESQKFTTGTFGLNWRVTDPLSLYFLHSEGVFPNTGQRDGADNPIGAEQTLNNEIGIKFDLFDGKLSGTISAYQIKRENAVYYWDAAPAPKYWHGGPQAIPDPDRLGIFSPQAAEGPGSGYLNGEHVPVSYGVSLRYVKKAFEDMGIPFPIDPNDPSKDSIPRQDTFNQWGAFFGTDQDVGTGSETRREFFVFAKYDELKDHPEGEVLRYAFELAMNRAPVEDPLTGEEGPFIGVPISYGGSFLDINNPTEGGTGSNITFEEEGMGLDGQLIYSPIPNYQVVFSYSVQQREITGNGFNLVDPIDSTTGKNWGTPYDYWIYVLGPENFEDPTRPSTFNGESVNGLDISFVPSESFRIWNKYTFIGGPLEGLELGGGVQYNGPTSTAVPIGGADLASNLYLTPEVPDRLVYDVFLSYRTSFWGMDWRINLKVANLLNDDEAIATAEYENQYGTPVKRHTVVYYEPRSWRCSVTMLF